jgi:uncharacterized protein (TIGR02246 family)
MRGTQVDPEENTMKKRAYLLLCGGFLVALTVVFVAALEMTLARAKASDDVSDSKRKADEAAIRKLSSDFSHALEQGDAKAVAGFWTDEGEYIGNDGSTLRGRAAIEDAYGKFLQKTGQVKVEMNIDSIRFVSQDSAIEEGYAKAQKGNSALPASSRYSILCARENGQWRIAVMREWPEQGAALRDIDWLIGTWAAKTENGEVSTTYEWDQNKKFIHVRFAIKGKDRTATGTEIIAKDPSTDGLRSWLFESDGGFGGSTWSREGKRWVMEATGVEENGTEMTATNILTPLGKDSFTWQSVNRTVDGEDQPDIPPIKVTRVK